MQTSSALRLVDRKLLSAIANGRTPTELEREFVGFTAEEIYVRVREILSSMDVWDEIEQRKLLVMSLQDLKRKVEIQLDAGDHRQVSALKDIILAIDKIASASTKVTEEEIKMIVQEQTAQMVRLISVSFGRVRSLINQQYQDIPLVELDKVFYEEFERNYNSATLEEVAEDNVTT